MFGIPDNEAWPRMRHLPNYNERQPKKQIESGNQGSLEKLFAIMTDPDAQDLFMKMMQVNPNLRSPCKDLINHIYFRNLRKQYPPDEFD